MNKDGSVNGWLVGLIVVCFLLSTQVQPPKPVPDDNIKPTPIPAGIQAQARESVRLYAMNLSANCREATKKSTLDEAYKFMSEANEKQRNESFKGWGKMIDDLGNDGDWRAALEQSAVGFSGALK